MIIGYARVSTPSQNIDAQIDALRGVGAEEVFAECVSGVKSERPELTKMLNRGRRAWCLI